jgi:hypothetical protein
MKSGRSGVFWGCDKVNLKDSNQIISITTNVTKII